MGADDAGCTESCAEEYGSSHGAVELAQHEASKFKQASGTASNYDSMDLLA